MTTCSPGAHAARSNVSSAASPDANAAAATAVENAASTIMSNMMSSGFIGTGDPANAGIGDLILIHEIIREAAAKMCRDSTDEESEEEKRRRYCQTLKDSILNTCAGLTGRKQFDCWQAANKAFRQCMGYE